MLPHHAVPGADWPFPSTGIWDQLPSWDNIHFLFEAMSHQSAWQDFETTSKTDELRDTCLVHHFHLDPKQKNRHRSNYRWFAFRDPRRFGNIWFNLGGTSRSLAILRGRWTSPEWMYQLARLYPRIATRYRIRGTGDIRPPNPRPTTVRHIWKHEPDAYPVVIVGGDVYICAGGRASTLDLENHADNDRWGVYITAHGSFAKYHDLNGEAIIEQIRKSAETAGRIEKTAES